MVFQLVVSENKGAIFFPSKFIDPLNPNHKPLHQVKNLLNNLPTSSCHLPQGLPWLQSTAFPRMMPFLGHPTFGD